MVQRYTRSVTFHDSSTTRHHFPSCQGLFRTVEGYPPTSRGALLRCRGKLLKGEFQTWDIFGSLGDMYTNEGHWYSMQKYTQSV